MSKNTHLTGPPNFVRVSFQSCSAPISLSVILKKVITFCFGVHREKQREMKIIYIR